MKTMGRALGAAEKRRRRLSRSPAGSIEVSRRQPPVHPPTMGQWPCLAGAWRPGANKDQHIRQDHRVVSFLRRCFPASAAPSRRPRAPGQKRRLGKTRGTPMVSPSGDWRLQFHGPPDRDRDRSLESGKGAVPSINLLPPASFS